MPENQLSVNSKIIVKRMENHSEYFQKIKDEFAKQFNLNPTFPDNSEHFAQYYYARTLLESANANKPRPVKYRQADVPESIMWRGEEYKELGKERDGLFHQVVSGIATINTNPNDNSQEIQYDYALIEDLETGFFFKIELKLVQFIKRSD